MCKQVCVVHPHSVTLTEVCELIEQRGSHPIDIDLDRWGERKAELRGADVIVIDKVEPVTGQEMEELLNVEEYCRAAVTENRDGHVSVLVRDDAGMPMALDADHFSVHRFSDPLDTYLDRLL